MSASVHIQYADRSRIHVELVVSTILPVKYSMSCAPEFADINYDCTVSISGDGTYSIDSFSRKTRVQSHELFRKKCLTISGRSARLRLIKDGNPAKSPEKTSKKS